MFSADAKYKKQMFEITNKLDNKPNLRAVDKPKMSKNTAMNVYERVHRSKLDNPKKVEALIKEKQFAKKREVISFLLKVEAVRTFD